MGKKSKKGQVHHAQHVHHKTGEGTHHHHQLHGGPMYNKYHHQDAEKKTDEAAAEAPTQEQAPTIVDKDMAGINHHHMHLNAPNESEKDEGSADGLCVNIFSSCFG
eukprot:CAMPEP_0172461922 /NCGR_PEP_ID=MMETSP1065-20121228/42179_1 /TAXON_ID=265537 /ORGANISM="Amphiprora paludosa, Strain CCMP125" /LENGTH=105 /DNA_ID=CAMNT_0013217417 /DNA_START=26 /DNA_END=343 /DNA_ORIENTATION=+